MHAERRRRRLLQRGPHPIPDRGLLHALSATEHVRATGGLIPLSVATGRIGLTAIRAARLQTLLADCGHDVDRSGTGLIVEGES
jgi:hypothetical protein